MNCKPINYRPSAEARKLFKRIKETSHNLNLANTILGVGFWGLLIDENPTTTAYNISQGSFIALGTALQALPQESFRSITNQLLFFNLHAQGNYHDQQVAKCLYNHMLNNARQLDKQRAKRHSHASP